MTEDKDATIGRLTAERDELKGRKTAAIINGDGPMVLSKAVVRKLVEDRDAARAEGFAQGIEAAVELHEQLWRETDAYKRERIRALSPTPQADFPKPARKDGRDPCGECRLQLGEICDICGASNTPQADPVREAALGVKRIVEEIDGAMRHGDWRDEHGVRLKDTPEWVALYNALAQKGE